MIPLVKRSCNDENYMLEESPIGNNISLEKKNYVATLIEKQFKGKNKKKNNERR